jgi:flagella basal body P-ring formation protein FlgA
MRHILTHIVCFFLVFSCLESQAAQLQQRESEIRAAVETFVQQKTAQLGYEVHIRKFSMSGPTTLPEGTVDYEVVAPQQWEGWGSANIAVIARQGNRVVRNIPIRVEVEALADMVIPVHQINQGSVINNGDVIVKKRDISGLQGRYVGRPGDAIGKKARTTLRPNAPIKPEQLEKIAMIRQGQTVTIIAENGNMRITVTGKAKNSGAEGDVITVQNSDSMKEFPARIIDAKTVAIVF